MRIKVKLITSAFALLIFGYNACEIAEAKITMISKIQTSLPVNELENAAQSKNPLGNDLMPIEDAITQFRNSFNKNPIMPKYIPFTPTHTGGTFRKSEKQMRVDYLNKNTDELVSLVIKLDDFKYTRDPVYVELSDKTKAVYIHDSKLAFDFIKFRKGDLTYQIAISKSGREGKEKLNELLTIANSIN